MRKAVLAAAGLVILAAVSWTAAPAQAMAISAPAALKGASDNIKLTEPVCWNCGWGPGYGYYRPYYRPWFRPYYRLAYYGYGGRTTGHIIGRTGVGTIGRTGPIGVATATTLPGRGFTSAQGSTGTNRRTGPGAAREMRKHLARAG